MFTMIGLHVMSDLFRWNVLAHSDSWNSLLDASLSHLFLLGSLMVPHYLYESSHIFISSISLFAFSSSFTHPYFLLWRSCFMNYFISCYWCFYHCASRPEKNSLVSIIPRLGQSVQSLLLLYWMSWAVYRILNFFIKLFDSFFSFVGYRCFARLLPLRVYKPRYNPRLDSLTAKTPPLRRSYLRWEIGVFFLLMCRNRISVPFFFLNFENFIL